MKSILNFFDGRAFIISLAIGIFFVYISSPEAKVIYIYPTPDNINNLLYKDKTDTCYKFRSKEMQCPAKESEIMKYPIQESIEDNNNK